MVFSKLCTELNCNNGIGWVSNTNIGRLVKPCRVANWFILAMSHSFFAMKPQVPELSLYFSTCNCLQINRNWLLLACIELFICPMLRRLVLMAPPYCFVKSTLSAWNCHSHYKNVSRQEPLTSRLYSDVDMSVLLLTPPHNRGRGEAEAEAKSALRTNTTQHSICAFRHKDALTAWIDVTNAYLSLQNTLFSQNTGASRGQGALLRL